jgi:acyl-CoA thioesterase-1
MSTAPGGVTYIALGASDAFGIGTYDPNDDSWPAALAGDLGGSVHLINLGIPGATAAQAVQEQLPIALDSRPNIVTVWLAVNDLADGVSLDDYARQLSALLTQLHVRTHARVYVGNLPDLALLPYFANQDPTALRTRIGEWNVRIAAICAETGAHLVDLSGYSAQLAQNPQYISRDGLHPSNEGAAALARVFAQAIQQPSTA